ncbi:unnamed protein product [Cuscuta epithymum]|uniref:Pentatricopeptide repeat-containing protein n=1 Tax=Cuscuta epithymum TaxID=186058 RepID=A0AAV0ENJ2_9ASTE|nr:unnamed protein product [Cuscuta epithymum]
MRFASIFTHVSASKNPSFRISNSFLFSTSSCSPLSASQQFVTHLQKNRQNIEKTLNSVKAKLDAPCVTQVLERFSVENPQTGLRFFIWAGLHPSYRHSRHMYIKACNMLKIDKNPKVITDVFEAYRDEDGCGVSVQMFRVVFNLCREAKDADLGLMVLRKMKEFNCRADVICYNGVIRLLCEKGDIDEAMGLMREMGLIDLYPDMATYTMIINRLSDVGRLEEACKMVKTMKGQGCFPGTTVYSSLLDGISRFGGLERAMELLDEMEKESSDCRPNVVTYTTLIQAFVEKGCTYEGMAILDKMESFGCKPNRVLMATLVQGLCRDGDINEAHKIVDRIGGNGGGISNDECHSCLVISLFRVGRFKEAEAVFSRMLASGLKPDTISYQTMMKRLCSERRKELDGYMA